MVTIESKKKWNDTGIDLIEGHQYSYEAIGKWKDWCIECDADGYSKFFMDLIGWIKRRPSAKWFQLIGSVEKNPVHTIDLSQKGIFTSPASGRLWVYANDADFAYCNNSGSLKLHIH